MSVRIKTEKKCLTCKKVKSIDEFSEKRARCKPCMRVPDEDQVKYGPAGLPQETQDYLAWELFEKTKFTKISLLLQINVNNLYVWRKSGKLKEFLDMYEKPEE